MEAYDALIELVSWVDGAGTMHGIRTDMAEEYLDQIRNFLKGEYEQE